MSVRVLFSVLFLGFYASACTNDQVQEMETFERDLLLTWVALERDDPKLAEYYGQRTGEDWRLLGGHYGAVPMHLEIKESVAFAGFWVNSLQTSISKKDRPGATIAVQLIQNQLRTLRPRFGYDQPTDHLYEFYYYWHNVTEASNDDMLCLLEWSEYEWFIDMAEQSWEEYLRSRPRYAETLFPGYGTQAALTEAESLELTRSLADFKKDLDASDHLLAGPASRVINDLFFDYLATITDYPQAGDLAENPL
ncbi:hypothetical protein [Neolewinella antarctica]|uniref:Uncharacterized protein n=1 Tax=Neolewinella antarctica TaxID=442734 RepID=A0ABX0X8L5_9BACT|nr:hypothetical protein [Neolewinella antarctica]NJC25585.1 hypothetical protein [Neolewinella antarctica]